MLKCGILKIKNTGKEYTAFYSSIQGKGVRLEIYVDPKDYDLLNTTKATAAYIRESQEYIYGDESLISYFLETMDKCMAIKGEIKQDSAFTTEGFKITQSKESTILGLTSSVTMLNGKIVNEIYESNDAKIDLDQVQEENTSVFIEPINKSDYAVKSILQDFVNTEVTGVDYWGLDVLKSRYELDHIEDCDYVVVQSLEEARERLTKWKDAKVKYKSVDTETTGLDVSINGTDVLTGVVLSYDWEPLGECENSTYFPFRQDNFQYNLPIEFLDEIQEAMQSQPKETEILAFNGKMEYKSFWKDGRQCRVDRDAYPLSCLIETRQERGLHTLKHRAYQATGLYYLELKDIFKGSEIRFNVLPPEIVRYYACPDAPNTIKVYKYLKARLPKTEEFVFKVESELQESKAESEYYGLRSAQETLINSYKNTEHIVNTLAEIFKKIHRTSANINSTAVLREIIYNQLGCPVKVRTDKGAPATSAATIEYLVGLGHLNNVDLENNVPHDILDLNGKVVVKGVDLKSNKYPSLVILAAYNKAKKELGALKRLQNKSNKDRIMFGINATGAASGRQTSDAHQYSDTMKEVIIPDTPDHRLISADYSQVELRVLAYLIQDKRLIEMMKDKHIDIHRAFLSTINNIPVYMISSAMRSAGKRVNFGVVYGISEYGLAKDKYGVNYTKEQLLECSKAITDFYNGIPGCKELTNQVREKVFKDGYVETKFGYRRMFPEVFTPGLEKRQVESIVRRAKNTPVQGTAAHLMKIAENNYRRYIKEKGWDKKVSYMGNEYPLVRVMLSIHDEVLISAHKSIPPEEIVIMCQKCMEIKLEGAPPFFAVPAFVDNWYQGKSDEFEMSISLRDDIVRHWTEKHESIVDWDNLNKSIKDYKLNEVKEYMEDLIRKYKTAENIIPNVTHPEFTHTLISIYVSKAFVKKHTQMECIEEAVRAYLENNDVSYLQVDDGDKQEDNCIKAGLQEYLDDIEVYTETDADGDLIVKSDEETEEKDNVREVIEQPTFEDTKVGIVYIGNTILIDTSEFREVDTLKKFHSDLKTLCSSEGYYEVFYLRGNSVASTGLKMEPQLKALQDIYDTYVS